MQNIHLKEACNTTIKQKKHLKATCNNNNIPNDHTFSKMYTTHCNMNKSILITTKKERETLLLTIGLDASPNFCIEVMMAFCSQCLAWT